MKKKAKGNKNPDVDTSFLPDRDREEEENKLREELRQVHSLLKIITWKIIVENLFKIFLMFQEWVTKQEALKQEPIEITYRYVVRLFFFKFQANKLKKEGFFVFV